MLLVHKTRLLSIVSKPILIVVVFVDIDVVFVKNMLGPKEIWLKTRLSIEVFSLGKSLD